MNLNSTWVVVLRLRRQGAFTQLLMEMFSLSLMSASSPLAAFLLAASTGQQNGREDELSERRNEDGSGSK